jgi:hypothetical protein
MKKNKKLLANILILCSLTGVAEDTIVTWKIVPRADYYEINYGTETMTVTAKTKNTKMMLTGIGKNKHYFVTVTAYDSVGNKSDTSPKLFFNTFEKSKTNQLDTPQPTLIRE